jgi:hypothetical protein
MEKKRLAPSFSREAINNTALFSLFFLTVEAPLQQKYGFSWVSEESAVGGSGGNHNNEQRLGL